MTVRRAVLDEHFSAYVSGRWAVLVTEASQWCADARDAEPLVTATLVRVGARRRRGFDPDDLDREVRRRMARTCIANGKLRAPGSDGIQLMELMDADRPAQAGTSELVRRALGELPPRQRIALVLRYREMARRAAVLAGPVEIADASTAEAAAADLVGCSIATLRRETAAGLAKLEGVLGVDGFGAVVGDGSSRTEALLRRALDAPLAPTTPPPLTLLDHRLARHRRRLLLAASAAAVVVIVVGIAVATGGSTHEPAPSGGPAGVGGVRPGTAVVIVPGAPVTFERSAFNFASAVTTGGGFVWSIENRVTKTGSHTYVVQRNPRTGGAVGRYRVPGADEDIAYGAGKVWAWRTNDFGATARIATVDGTGAVQFSRFMKPITIEAAAFTDKLSWFTEPDASAVAEYTGSDLGSQSMRAVHGAQYVVPVSPTSVVVGSSFGRLHELPGNRAVGSHQSFLTQLVSAPSYGIWMVHNNRLAYQSSIKARVSLALALPHTVGSVSGDPAHGVYVAQLSDDPDNRAPYLAYYSPAALALSHPRPTAQLKGPTEVESMTADPAGGVVFATNQGAVERWTPVSSELADGRSLGPG